MGIDVIIDLQDGRIVSSSMRYRQTLNQTDPIDKLSIRQADENNRSKADAGKDPKLKAKNVRYSTVVFPKDKK